MTHSTSRADQLAVLRHLHPGWEFSTMSRLPSGVLWVARRRDSMTTLRAHSPAELHKAITDREAEAAASPGEGKEQ